MSASNEFDPGWNKKATIYSYKGTLYKKTDGERVDFNHSYSFGTHTEEEGKETYKYTVGNTIADGKIYIVSRHDKNTIAETDKTFGTQLEFMLGATNLTGYEVDCVKEIAEKDGSFVYTIFTSDSCAEKLQERICKIINSNEAEGVIPVDNRFNEINEIKDSEIKFVLKNGSLVSAVCKTVIKYFPKDGADSKITLTDKAEIIVDKHADKAEEYTAPQKAETPFTGLNASKFYIN